MSLNAGRKNISTWDSLTQKTFSPCKVSQSLQRNPQKMMSNLKEDLQQERGVLRWESELIIRSKKRPMGWLLPW